MRTANTVRRSLAAVAALIFFAGCGSDTTTPTKARPIASIALTPASFTLGRGATQQLRADLLDASGAAVDGATATWTTSNPAIATVDVDGNVFGAGLGGPVEISATANGHTATASVTVVPANVSLTPVVTSLAVGQSVRLTATAYDAAGATIDAGTPTFVALPPGLATIDQSGLLTALISGTVTVYASMAGTSRQVDILLGVPSAYDGSWTGFAGNSPVEFDVLFGAVRRWSIPSIPYPSFCESPPPPTFFTISVTATIANDAFAVPVPSASGGGVIDGMFTSPTDASGSIPAITVPPFVLCTSTSSGHGVSQTSTMAAFQAATFTATRR